MRPISAVTFAMVLPAAVLVLPLSAPVASPRPVSPDVVRVPLDSPSARGAAKREAARPVGARSVPQDVVVEGSEASARPSQGAEAAGGPALVVAPEEVAPFDVVGVTWEAEGPAPTGVFVRTRTDGTWSDWQALEVAAGGPDDGSAEARRAAARGSTEPLVSLDADGLEVRVDTADGTVPGAVEAVLVDAGSSPADAAIGASSGSVATAAPASPGILTRAQWGADEGLRQRACPSGPDYGRTIQAGFVHHTAGVNGYAPAQVPEIIRGIYAFHVEGRGWCDVGYNVLVDAFGRAWEGRYGGLERVVIGAHTGGFNADTFGVSVMGEFTQTQPSGVMLDAVGRVLGWKLGMHRRDPGSTVVLTSAGGGTSRYPAGVPVTFGVVSGHRDAGFTECPGDQVYSHIQGLRIRATVYIQQTSAPDADLYGALLNGTGSGQVEVHAESRASGYTARLLSAATGLHQVGTDDWRVFFGSLYGDGRPDLIAVRTRGTGSGRLEVHAWSWASGYRAKVLAVATPMYALPPDEDFQLAVGPRDGGRADLFLVRARGSGSGRVELHVLSAASGYSQWVEHAVTALPPVDSSRVRFLVDPNGQGDLSFVIHQAPTGTGRAEFHTLGRAYGYGAYTVHAALPMSYTDDQSTQHVLGDLDRDGRPDLAAVSLTGTGSGRVELHGLGSRDGYQSWIQHAATSLPSLPATRWQFALA